MDFFMSSKRLIFTLNDCESEREIYCSCFASLDVDSSIESTSAQLFLKSLSQCQSLNVNDASARQIQSKDKDNNVNVKIKLA